MDAILKSTIVQDGHTAPVIQSLMKSMYETGILKAGCAVLRCEGFDEAATKEVQWIKDTFICNSERPTSFCTPAHSLVYQRR